MINIKFKEPLEFVGGMFSPVYLVGFYKVNSIRFSGIYAFVNTKWGELTILNSQIKSIEHVKPTDI